MKSIDEFAVALDGEWDTNIAYSSISMGMMRNKYRHVCAINNNLEAFELSNSAHYVIGFFAEVFDKHYNKLMVRFAVVSDISILITGNEMPIPLYRLRKDNT